MTPRNYNPEYSLLKQVRKVAAEIENLSFSFLHDCGYEVSYCISGQGNTCPKCLSEILRPKTDEWLRREYDITYLLNTKHQVIGGFISIDRGGMLIKLQIGENSNKISINGIYRGYKYSWSCTDTIQLMDHIKELFVLTQNNKHQFD